MSYKIGPEKRIWYCPKCHFNEQMGWTSPNYSPELSRKSKETEQSKISRVLDSVMNSEPWESPNHPRKY